MRDGAGTAGLTPEMSLPFKKGPLGKRLLMLLGQLVGDGNAVSAEALLCASAEDERTARPAHGPEGISIEDCVI